MLGMPLETAIDEEEPAMEVWRRWRGIAIESLMMTSSEHEHVKSLPVEMTGGEDLKQECRLRFISKEGEMKWQDEEEEHA